MAKSVKSKMRGRPATGRDPMMRFRASPRFRASIVRWTENQPATPSLLEAVRRPVELGLTVKANPKQPAAARADRAKELAAKAIDKMLDPSAPQDERDLRRRRLTKDPVELRDNRINLPKRKG